jgi:hypothetical protein
MIRRRLPLPSSGAPFLSCFHLVTAFRKNISSKPFGIWAKKEREHPAAQLFCVAVIPAICGRCTQKEIRQKPVLRTWQFYRKS